MFDVRCGIVGCGVVAHNKYIPAVKRYGILEAVCDIREVRARRTAEVWGARSYFTDLIDMLEKADLDVVFILTGMDMHADHVIEAARMGKHILVQKPLATSLDKLREVIETVERAKVKVLVEPSVHLNPIYSRALNLLGDIGSPYWFMAGFGRHPPSWGEHTFFSRGGGGPLFDLGVYEVSLLTFLLGPAMRVTAMGRISISELDLIDDEYLNHHLPESVSKNVWEIIASAPRTRRIKVEVEDNIMVLMEMVRGTVGVVISNYVTPREFSRPSRAEIYGSNGFIDIPVHSSRNPVISGAVKTRDGVKPISVDGASLGLTEHNGWFSWDYYEASVKHLLECIVEDREPLPNIYWGAHVSEILIKSIESIRSGRSMDITLRF
ncbi:MAG: Gfo/Idh/MocA family oxidoreductase [Candidatus Bathyarchaeota archaeon]|nr:Gfo/Idh/MocA family oxidoreductase [Candidatus Bathyarchaeota archaeon]